MRTSIFLREILFLRCFFVSSDRYKLFFLSSNHWCLLRTRFDRISAPYIIHAIPHYVWLDLQKYCTNVTASLTYAATWYSIAKQSMPLSDSQTNQVMGLLFGLLLVCTNHLLVKCEECGAGVVATHFADPDALNSSIPNTRTAIQTTAMTNTPVPTCNTEVLAILLRSVSK